MAKVQFHYWIKDLAMTVDDARSIDLEIGYNPHRLSELKEIAEKCAEDHHRRHAGYDSPWPMFFVIANEDREVLGEVEVEREVEPCFVAVWGEISQSPERLKLRWACPKSPDEVCHYKWDVKDRLILLTSGAHEVIPESIDLHDIYPYDTCLYCGEPKERG